MVFYIGSPVSQVDMDIFTGKKPLVGKSLVLHDFPLKLFNGFLSSHFQPVD